MRKLITAVADIGYKLFQANEVAEIFAIIDEEIGRESVECQARIRERIQRRRNIDSWWSELTGGSANQSISSSTRRTLWASARRSWASGSRMT